MKGNMKILYPIGLSGANYISIEGPVYSLSESLPDNMIRIIKCNIEEKWMKVFEGPCMSKEKNLVYSYEWKNKKIIGIKDNSDKWEGEFLHGKPIGYGSLTQGGYIVYKGFMYEGMKVCFGTLYSSDGITEEYQGSFYKNMKYGYGIQYDRTNGSQYEGEWVNDNNDAPLSCVVTSELNEADIHFGIQQLRVCCNCISQMKQLKLNGFTHLKSLIIEDNCFKSVEQFEIENCNELEEVVIGNQCFICHLGKDCQDWNNDGCFFSIKSCLKLSSITIGNQSFGDYSSCFSLVSRIRVVFLIIRFASIEEFTTR